jgi:hypothetical protein
MSLCYLAKKGDPEATAILKHTFQLKVYTEQEITQINRLISTGMTLDQAIKELSHA